MKIVIPTTKFDRLMNVACILILGMVFLMLFLKWGELPEKIPMSFSFSGEINRWGTTGEVLVMPIMAVAMLVCLSLVERFPGIWNTGVWVTEENKFRVYRELKNLLVVTKTSVMIVFSMITLVQAFSPEQAQILMPLVLALIFGPMICCLFRVFRAR